MNTIGCVLVLEKTQLSFYRGLSKQSALPTMLLRRFSCSSQIHNAPAPLLLGFAYIWCFPYPLIRDNKHNFLMMRRVRLFAVKPEQDRRLRRKLK